MGFLLEVSFARAVDHPKKDRKCLLLLPLCPVYGVGALLILWLVPLGDGPLWVMAVGALAPTAAELGMGLFYREALGVRFWDYHAMPWNLDGLVCLPFSVCWAVLALGLVYVLHPMTVGLVERFPDWLGPPAACLLGADMAVSAAALKRQGDAGVLRWYR